MHLHRRWLPKYHASSTYTERNNKWDLLKLRSFCKTKDTVNKTKWQSIGWANIFTNYTSDRGLTPPPKYTKNSRNWSSNEQIKKGRFRPKQRPLNKWIWNGWKALKKMLNILNHQKNANQNDTEISSYTCRKAKIKTINTLLMTLGLLLMCSNYHTYVLKLFSFFLFFLLHYVDFYFILS